MPLIAGYAYHKGAYKNLKGKELQKLFLNKTVAVK